MPGFDVIEGNNVLDIDERGVRLDKAFTDILHLMDA